MASAIGTSTACAQYKTAMTSTHPAKVTHGFKMVTSFAFVNGSIYRSASRRVHPFIGA